MVSLADNSPAAVDSLTLEEILALREAEIKELREKMELRA